MHVHPAAPPTTPPVAVDAVEGKAHKRAWTLHSEDWRERLLQIVFRITLVIGGVVYVPSVYVAWSVGQPSIVVTDTLAMALVIALNVSKRGSFLLRALAFCVIVYALGVVLLMTVGPVAQIYLFAFSLVATLLLRLRAGMLTVALNGVTLLGIGLSGYGAPTMALDGWGVSPFAWGVLTANFVFMNTVLAVALGAVVAFLERTLLEERRARLTIECEREALRLANDALTREAIERARTEAELRTTEARFSELANHIGDGFYSLDPASLSVQYINRMAEVIWGASGRELLESSACLFERIHPEDRGEIMEARDEQSVGRATVCSYRVLDRQQAGAPRWVRDHAYPVFDEAGNVCRIVGTLRDITEERQMEAERESLNEQIRQAQRLDAVGKLAGGVAHDFNNMLSVIMGHASLARESAQSTPELKEDIDQIIEAAERSAGLTRQLLAFARRQTATPQVLDIDETLASAMPILERVVGEGIEISWRPGNAGRVRMDPAEVDQILVNLAVNARDATAGVGRISIETTEITIDEEYCRVHADSRLGHYVVLSVSDDGCGMDDATRAQVFEPFFTTKAEGQGTGLGLATLHGIVKQNGGMVSVYSELGRGTTFRIYLPVERAVSDVSSSTERAPVSVGGVETILIVEDEARLCALTERILKRLGYHLLVAKSPLEALEVAASHAGEIHLLLTDVVMPHMSGRELWERLRTSRPALPCLFMSGYTANILGTHGILDHGVRLLEKPFGPRDLADKVRESLDDDRGSGVRLSPWTPRPVGGPLSERPGPGSRTPRQCR